VSKPIPLGHFIEELETLVKFFIGGHTTKNLLKQFTNESRVFFGAFFSETFAYLDRQFCVAQGKGLLGDDAFSTLITGKNFRIIKSGQKL
jgi:hypothetical protein